MKSSFCKKTKMGLVVASAFGLSIMAACSGSDEKGVAGGVSEDAGFYALKDVEVAGVAQKGPFVKGSEVVVQGIDCKTMELSDERFEGSVKSDKGDFGIDGVTFTSSCAMLEVTGNYLDELTGKKSKSEITLRAITDLKDRKNVNVNLLTHLESERVMRLVAEKNKAFADAKTQAEREVLTAFEIKDTVDRFEDLNLLESGNGNAALLAVSVVMLAETDELSKRLDKLSDGFAENGSLNDSVKSEIVEWAAAVSADGKLDSIRKNIEGWGYTGNVSSFEKFIPAVESVDSTEGSSSSAAQDSLEENVSSSSVASDSVEKVDSSSSKEEPRDTTVTSSSSEVAADTASSSSVVPPVSSSSVRDSLSQDSLRSSSSIVPKDSTVRDTSVRDTAARDTTVRDTSARDTGSVKPDTSVAKKDSSIAKKDTSGCPNTEFPHELSYLLGNDYEIAEARCPGDSVVVTWRSRHEVYETEFSVPRTYVFAADFEQYVADSLDRFRSEWLDRASGYDGGEGHEESREKLVNELYGASYADEDLSEIGETTLVYSYRMDLKNAIYLVYAFSVPQVLISASGSRTIRYGFVVELVGVYYASK